MAFFLLILSQCKGNNSSTTDASLVCYSDTYLLQVHKILFSGY